MTTATACGRRSREAALEKLSDLCATNAASLQQATEYCAKYNIGCFRVLSQVLPLKTHPQHGYELAELPQGENIREQFIESGKLAAKHDPASTSEPRAPLFHISSPRDSWEGPQSREWR